MIRTVRVTDAEVESPQWTVDQYPIDSHPGVLVRKSIAKTASNSVECVLKSIELFGQNAAQTRKIRVARKYNGIRTRS